MVDQDYIDVALQSSGLNAEEGSRFVADPRAGGVVTFSGVTRSITDGRETVLLSYEAYAEMAEATMREIAQEAANRLDICRVWIRHRTGVVPAGEASVVIVIAAAHRADAFEACRYVIDQLKERVPIWKKERFADGSEEWVDPSGSHPVNDPDSR